MVYPVAGLTDAPDRAGGAIRVQGGLSILPVYGPVGDRIAAFFSHGMISRNASGCSSSSGRVTGYASGSFPSLSQASTGVVPPRDPVRRELLCQVEESLLSQNAIGEVRDAIPGLLQPAVLCSKEGDPAPRVFLMAVEFFQMETVRSFRKQIFLPFVLSP